MLERILLEIAVMVLGFLGTVTLAVCLLVLAFYGALRTLLGLVQRDCRDFVRSCPTYGCGGMAA